MGSAYSKSTEMYYYPTELSQEKKIPENEKKKNLQFIFLWLGMHHLIPKMGITAWGRQWKCREDAVKLDPSEPRQLLEKRPREKNKDRHSKFCAWRNNAKETNK